MRLNTESRLWGIGPAPEDPPLVAVLEVGGAVMSWTVDVAAPPRITFLDHQQADWLWHVVGEPGHVALAAAMEDAATPDSLEISGAEIVAGSLEDPRRLALGHWLRRWWPTSVLDGIGPLDQALLDAEVALLTAQAQHFFAGDTFDSDVTTLLAPHAAALIRHVRGGDHRIMDMVARAVELAEETGAAAGPDSALWLDLADMLDDSGLRAAAGIGQQDDYALAAGSGTAIDTEAISRGAATIKWGAVPPHTFDAAENTAEWVVPIGDGDNPATAVVRTMMIGGDPSGIAVTLRSGTIAGAAELDGRGAARIALRTGDQVPSESELWGHDWSSAALTVGVPVDEPVESRERVRRFVRQRLAAPPEDAFLAEILAAEADY
ncbi:hypothetical protein DFR67_1134 [Williamsia limnetica]|uniref:Uncharacterized protein n=1 Tax=Williamsia limnetica TaxID=882452 RepID=A0A318RCZ0_WILLI|nr:hypothetical protein [Williamsia limnetica]PYE14210.1 hypothetical protein DFR67_1134 [Williamsia limnetica]